MNTHYVAALGLMLLLSGVACADASYEQTSQITGGTITDTIKSVGFLGNTTKKLLAPKSSLTMVHGDQKAVIGKSSTEIIDLGKQTITHIDTEKKTYSVMTFAQMRQAFADMMKKFRQAPPKQMPAAQLPKSDLKTSFEVSVKNTGLSKSVNGLTAEEQVVELKMHVTNPKGAGSEAQNTATYTVKTDAWIAPDPPEMTEIKAFNARMAKKMMQGVDLSAFSKAGGASAGLAQIIAGKPGMAEAMTQMQKEMAKLKGTRVMEVMQVGGEAPAAGEASAGGETPGGGQTSAGASAVATQVATDTAAQVATSETGRLGVVGAALSNSVFGAFRRLAVKRPAPATPAAAPAATAVPATPAAATQPMKRVVLMETTMQLSNFSQEAIPPSAFEVPTGFKQVPSMYERMRK